MGRQGGRPLRPPALCRHWSECSSCGPAHLPLILSYWPGADEARVANTFDLCRPPLLHPHLRDLLLPSPHSSVFGGAFIPTRLLPSLHPVSFYLT